MKISDDLYNKYIDNELNEKELADFNQLLSLDPDAVQKLKSLQTVERLAKKIETFDAPDGFSGKIMAKIKPQFSKRYQKNYFFRFIISLFTVLFFSISGLMISFLVNSNADTISKKSIFIDLSQEILQKISIIEKFFMNSNNLLISGSAILLLLLSLFFILEPNLSSSQKIGIFKK